MSKVHILPVAGGVLKVDDTGDGPPLLLIHGIPTNRTLWREVVPGVSTGRRVLVPDLVGFGESERRVGAPVDVASQASYLVEGLDQLGVDQVDVVAQDIGGGVAHSLVFDHTARVRSLQLINAVAYDSWPVPEMKRVKAWLWLLRWLPPIFLTSMLRRGLRDGFNDSAKADEYIPRFLAPFQGRTGYRNLLDHIAALDSRHTRERSSRLGDLGIPFGLAWGDADPFQQWPLAIQLHNDAPEAVLERLPGVSHFSPADAPDRVARAIVAHLDRVSDHPQRPRDAEPTTR